MSDTTATVNGHVLQMPTQDAPPADDLLDLLDLLNCLARLTQPLRIVIARPGGLTVVLSAAYPSGAVEPERPAPTPAPAAPAPPPPPEDSAGCRADVLRVLEGAGRRLTWMELRGELKGRGLSWSESSLRKQLARLVREGSVTNDTSTKPRGYALANLAEG